MKHFKAKSKDASLSLSVEKDDITNKNVLFIDILENGYQTTYAFKDYWQLKRLKDWLDNIDLSLKW